MKKKVEKVNFDMSILSLKELIQTYEEITEFKNYLEEKKIIIDKKEKGDKNE